MTEENGLYTFVVDGYDYNFRDQDGSAILFNTHFEGAVHPEFFSNLTQLIKFAESFVSNYGMPEQEVEVVEPEVEAIEVTEVPEITEVIESPILEDTDCYRLVREFEGYKFYTKAFNSRIEAKDGSRYDCQAQVFENGKWLNLSNYGYSEDYITSPDTTDTADKADTENTDEETLDQFKKIISIVGDISDLSKEERTAEKKIMPHGPEMNLSLCRLKSDVSTNREKVEVGTFLRYGDCCNNSKFIVTELIDGGFRVENLDGGWKDIHFFDHLQLGWDFA